MDIKRKAEKADISLRHLTQIESYRGLNLIELLDSVLVTERNVLLDLLSARDNFLLIQTLSLFNCFTYKKLATLCGLRVGQIKTFINNVGLDIEFIFQLVKRIIATKGNNKYLKILKLGSEESITRLIHDMKCTSHKELAQICGISRTTLYKALSKRELNINFKEVYQR